MQKVSKTIPVKNKGKSTKTMSKPVKSYLPSGVDDQMLHKIVAQNKYDIAPYAKFGKSRTLKGRSTNRGRSV